MRAKESMSLHEWVERHGGKVFGALLAIAVALQLFYRLGEWIIWVTIGASIAGYVAVRKYAARKARGGKDAPANLSGRLSAIAAAFRKHAEKVEGAERFGKSPPQLDPMFIEEVHDVERILSVRGLDGVGALEALDASSDALRARAERFEAIAVDIRGKKTPYHMPRGELIGCIATLLVAAIAGGVLLSLHFTREWEKGPAFYVGIGLVIASLLGAAMAFMMQTERQ